MEMTDLMVVDLKLMAIHVTIVSLATIGNIEWLRHFFDNGERAMGARRKDRALVIASTAFLLVSATMQMPFVPHWVTLYYNFVTLGNAMVKFGHKALVKIPDAIISKALGVRPEQGERE